MSGLALDPTRAALLVIDVQQAFDLMEEAGARRNNPDALARIAALLATFRSAGLPVIHIHHRGTRPGSLFQPDGPGFAVRNEARERPGEVVLVKTANSAFIGTDLETRLRRAGHHHLVLCGATTNHCVETTARMAGNLGFDPILARDAAWTFDRTGPDGEVFSAEALHATTLANLHGEFARIAWTDTILAALPIVLGDHDRSVGSRPGSVIASAAKPSIAQSVALVSDRER